MSTHPTIPDRPLGWKISPHDPEGIAHTADLRRAGVRRGGELAEADHSHTRTRRLYQRGEACVGYTLRSCWYGAKLLGGETNPKDPSAQWFYAIGRQQENSWKLSTQESLVDDGSYPYLVLRGARNVGAVSVQDYADDSVSPSAVPPSRLDRKAYDARGLDFGTVLEKGRARLEAVDELMRKGWTAMHGIQVDSAYLAHMGQGAVGEINPSAILGGHMQRILKVDLVGFKVLVENWWYDWGILSGPLAGCGWLDGELFGSSNIVSDVYVLRNVPPM
jgi:hypothetical protein